MREAMLQLEEEGIVVAAAVQIPEVPPGDLWIGGKASGRRDSQRVLMEISVARQASLISHRSHEIVAQVVLGVHGPVMGTRGGQCTGEDFNVHGAACWHAIHAKRRNGGRVRRATTSLGRT